MTETKPIETPSDAADVVEDTKGSITQGSGTIDAASKVEAPTEKETDNEVIETGVKRSIENTEESTKDEDSPEVAEASEISEQPNEKKVKTLTAEDESDDVDEDDEDDKDFAGEDEEEEEDEEDEEEEEVSELNEEEDDEPEIVEGEDDLNLVGTIEQAESELEVGATPTATEA